MTGKKISLYIIVRNQAFNQKFKKQKSAGFQPKTSLMSVQIQTLVSQKSSRKEENLRRVNNLKKALMMRIAKKEIWS